MSDMSDEIAPWCLAGKNRAFLPAANGVMSDEIASCDFVPFN
jgi:hypothetical protein